MGDARLTLKTETESQKMKLQNSQTSHQSRFEKLLESRFLSDLKISVKGVGFHTHKLIVATGSPLLYEKIEVEVETNHGTGFGVYSVDKDVDTEPRIFQMFLKFLYTGNCDLVVEDALPLLQIAGAYRVADLGEKCESLLNQDLTDETAIHIYQQAVHYKKDDLMEKALHYVCRNAWSIIESNEFCELTLDNLKRLLRSDQLLVLNETQLIRGLFRWSKKQLDKNMSPNINKILEQFSSWISWDRVEPEKFEETDDIIELEKLFNAFCPLGPNTKAKRQCKFTRKYFEDNDNSFVVSRLPQKFAYCTDNKSLEPEVIKFKTDVSICLLSIGVPAYSQQTCGDFFNVEIEIFDDKNKMVVSERVSHSKGMYHLKLPKPFKIRKDNWYTISGVITGAAGYGNMGGKSVAYVKCDATPTTNGSQDENEMLNETIVKFDFKGLGTNVEYISGGKIDELVFKLVEN